MAFTGGGVLLAGVSLTALMLYRRRQFQRRHPGRTVGGSPPELIGMERAVLAAGSAGLTDVTWLDEALRSLVQSIADPARWRSLPDVIAVRITDAELTLVLTDAGADRAATVASRRRCAPAGRSSARTRCPMTPAAATPTSRRSPRWPRSATP